MKPSDSHLLSHSQSKLYLPLPSTHLSLQNNHD
ncbi:Uncharacterised protein [Vibrio cholerae]|nr:Uncharacterised protein [Vibrio cholerae]